MSKNKPKPMKSPTKKGVRGKKTWPLKDSPDGMGHFLQGTNFNGHAYVCLTPESNELIIVRAGDIYRVDLPTLTT